MQIKKFYSLQFTIYKFDIYHLFIYFYILSTHPAMTDVCQVQENLLNFKKSSAHGNIISFHDKLLSC